VSDAGDFALWCYASASCKAEQRLESMTQFRFSSAHFRQIEVDKPQMVVKFWRRNDGEALYRFPSHAHKCQILPLMGSGQSEDRFDVKRPCGGIPEIRYRPRCLPRCFGSTIHRPHSPVCTNDLAKVFNPASICGLPKRR
jgi:hypothetical protein